MLLVRLLCSEGDKAHPRIQHPDSATSAGDLTAIRRDQRSHAVAPAGRGGLRRAPRAQGGDTAADILWDCQPAAVTGTVAPLLPLRPGIVLLIWKASTKAPYSRPSFEYWKELPASSCHRRLSMADYIPADRQPAAVISTATLPQCRTLGTKRPPHPKDGAVLMWHA